MKKGIACLLSLLLIIGMCNTGLSRDAFAVSQPTIQLRYPSLSFEDEVYCNIYFTVENGEAIQELGLLTFDSAQPNGTIGNAGEIIPGSIFDGVLYRVRTNGIPAKKLGDTMYFKVYAKLTDGSYVYSELQQYSAVSYALDRLANSDNAALKALCVAMLNYGSAAQQYFGYREDTLATAGLTQTQLALAGTYSEDSVNLPVKAEQEKQGAFLSDGVGYSHRYSSVSFDGVFGIHFYFSPKLTVDTDVRFYYWDAETYDSVDVLNTQNATGTMTMTPMGDGRYKATVGDIAAKELDATVFVAGVYESAGVSYSTGVLSYHLGAYCVDRVNNGGEAMGILAAATAVYGCRAKDYFGGYTAFATAVQKVQNLQTDSTLTISAMSDTHYEATGSYADKQLAAAQAMGKLTRLCKVDLVANLGDLIPGNESRETALANLTKLMETTAEGTDAPLYFLRGNHDDNGWYSYGNFGGSYQEEEIISGAQWDALVRAYQSEGIVTDEHNPQGGYGYFDHEPSKIRVFLLNTSDIPYILEEDGTYRYNSYETRAFSNAQVNFVAEALQFADKETPREWAALFLSHIPLDTTNDSGYRFGITDALISGSPYMLAVINAYQKGTAFAAEGTDYNLSKGDIPEDFYVSVDVDYSINGTGTVLGFISGHTHTDNFSRSVGYENSLSYGYPFLSLFGENTFANFVVNREEKKISVVSYGKTTPDISDATVEAPDDGSIRSGAWSVALTDNLPTGENLSCGYSELWTQGGYTFDGTTRLDVDTLEVTSLSTAYNSGVAMKAIAVKPFTRYALPKDFSGMILAFDANGNRSYYLTPTAGEDYQWIQTDIRHCYIAIVLHTATYPDYRNFMLKEIYSGMEF